MEYLLKEWTFIFKTQFSSQTEFTFYIYFTALAEKFRPLDHISEDSRSLSYFSIDNFTKESLSPKTQNALGPMLSLPLRSHFPLVSQHFLSLEGHAE